MNSPVKLRHIEQVRAEPPAGDLADFSPLSAATSDEGGLPDVPVARTQHDPPRSLTSAAQAAEMQARGTNPASFGRDHRQGYARIPRERGGVRSLFSFVH